MSDPLLGTRVALLALAVALFAGPAARAAEPAPNTLTDGERAAGWQLLFDGTSLDGWRGYRSPEIPGGWQVANGTLHFVGSGGGRGDLITVNRYANFELSLEWCISAGGNSGILYLAELGSDEIYMSAPEMQVLDDARHPDGQNPLTSAGADYGLYPAPRGVVRPAGEWNQVLIRVRDERVEHWLNGQKIVEYTLGSPDWTARVAKSKFAKWPEYGKSRSGFIGLQDHGDPVWYRNIKIRVLD